MAADTNQLIHIKQLFLRAEAIAEKDDDVSLIILVQLLDFVVDTLLKSVIHAFPTPTKFNIPQAGYYNKITTLEGQPYKSNMDFYRAWDEAVGRLRDPANGLTISDLPLRKDMDRLHEIRNDVQHKGAVPNPKDAKKYVPLVESFLKNTFKDIYSIEFDTLTSTSLIKDEQLREYLQQAHQALEQKAWTQAVCEASIALHILILFAQRIAHRENESLFAISRMASQAQYGNARLLGNSHVDGIEGILSEIVRLRRHVAVLGFGLDYAEYVTIESLLPSVSAKEMDEDDVQVVNWETKIPKIYATELDNWVIKIYTEAEARKIVTFVERQALETQAKGIFGI